MRIYESVPTCTHMSCYYDSVDKIHAQDERWIMSYIEAIEDNVRFCENKYGDKFYFPKCVDCGEEIRTLSYIRNVNYRCPKCKLLLKAKDNQLKQEQSFEKKEAKFNKAIKRLSEKVKNLKLYNKAIQIVHDNLHKTGWFDSTEEILVAIELIKNNISVRHQVKFGNYRADFVLPQMKVVLEVDGIVYHNDRTVKHERLRDNLIVLSLGAEWEVVRITDEQINKNITKLVPAIRTVLKMRKEKRSENEGLLPTNYTKTEI